MSADPAPVPSAREVLRIVNSQDGSLASRLGAVVLAARVEAVLALHGPPTASEAKYADLCHACGELWPCPTVRLLNGGKP